MVLEKSVKITAIIAGTIIILALLGYFMFNSVIPASNTVSVNGNSVLKVSPDVVGIYFNIETAGKTATEAKDNNSEISDKLITSLVKLGFERKDIQTQNYNIYPDYQWINGQNVQKGFRAINSIRIELKSDKLSLIGDVIDSGVDAGAAISYINFELSNDKQNEYKSLALKQAGEDALVKATAIAEGLGKHVGKIVSVSTQDFRYSPWNLYTSNSGGAMADVAMAKEAATNIQPGDQEVSGNIVVVYQLR